MSYQRLLAYATLQLSPLTDHRPVTPQGRFIVEAARELAAAVPVALVLHGDRDDGPAYDFVDLCADSDPDDPDLPARDLWIDLMREWPMGLYAHGLARHLPDDMKTLRVLEVGAGIGNLTLLIRGRVGDNYLRTDLNPRLPESVDAPGRVARWDFNDPWNQLDDHFDLVVAVNALHCARDPATTLNRLRAITDPTGRIILAEGAPYTHTAAGDVAPWALTAPFGALDGWWDRGGFLPPYRWCGLDLRVAERLVDDGHQVGAVYEGTPLP